jgi:exosortase A
LLTSALLWLLAWYGETVQSLVATWLGSETFAHGFLILPITLWLVWRRRHIVRALVPRPNFWMVLPLAVAGCVWLLGNLASVVVVQQYALIIMILFLLATIIGNKIVSEIAFPLLFLLFLVPFGEVFLPALMEYTADFTVVALRLTGIPVYREGLYFSVPSGNWSVIEACSGLRYLIASVTLGVLYAYLTYRSLTRRVTFVLLSIVVPIVANWLRAYMIVMIGHLTTMKHAVGVDHMIYGWIFFGVVMLILFWVGTRWREDSVSETAIMHTSIDSAPIRTPVWRAILTATLASSAVAASLPAIASHLKGGFYQQPVLQVPPEAADWRFESAGLTDWTPRFMHPSARINQSYVSATGRVQLFVWYYRNQRQGAQLVSSQNALVPSADANWANTGALHRVLNINGNEIPLIESRSKGRETRLLTWHWYWIGGQYTSNAYWAKLLQAKSVLLGRGDNAALIVVATPHALTPTSGADLLQKFVQSMLPAVGKVLQDAN